MLEPAPRLSRRCAACRSLQDFGEGLRALELRIATASASTSTRLGENLHEDRFGIAPIGRHSLDGAVLGKGKQRLLRHGVDRVGRRQRFDIKHVRGRGILGAGAGPQQALRPGPGCGQFLPALRMPADRGRLCRCAWRWRCRGDCATRQGLVLDSRVPAADEKRRHGSDLGIESGGDAPLDAAHIRFGRRNIVLAREQQRDVDRHAARRSIPRSRVCLPACRGS